MAQTGAGLKDQKRPFFYGWYIVLAAFLAHIAYAEQNSSNLGVFIRPMTREFGWSRTELTGAQSAARLVEGLFAPFIGPFIDRLGPRPLMLIGSVISGAGFFWLSRIHTLWEFYLIKGGVVAIGFLFMGNMVTNTAISNWFMRLRGRAIGIAGMGTSLSSIGVAPLAVWMIGQWDWRAAWMAFGIVTWVMVLVPSGLLMRRRPEDMGLRPDGDSPPPGAPPSGMSATPGSVPWPDELEEPVWSRREVLHTRAFWLIIITYSISGLASGAVNISLIPYFEDLGFEAGLAAAALSIRAALSLLGAPFWGLAAERIDARRLGFLIFTCQGLAAFLLMVGRDIPLLFAGIVAYSLGSAGGGVISETIWAGYYGRLTLGSIRGMGTPMLTAFSAAGPVLMSAIFDITGSYAPAFLLFMLLFAFSAVMILFLKPPQPVRFARASEFHRR